MVVRAIALSLALLLGIGIIVPLSTDNAEAGPRKAKKSKKHQRGWKGVKKYSKRWWQLYRAQERRKKALAKNRRALKLRQIRLARAGAAEPIAQGKVPSKSVPAKSKKTVASSAAVLPSGDPAPAGWNAAESSPAELRFRVDDSAGSQVGSASISVVGPAIGEAGATVSSKAVGGVSTATLRREVINKMIQENGWVVNDYKKQIGGRDVYVVVAQSQARNGRVQSRMFYFTEVDGRIYSVATNSPVEEAERLAEESEKVIDSLQSRIRPVQRAAIKE